MTNSKPFTTDSVASGRVPRPSSGRLPYPSPLGKWLLRSPLYAYRVGLGWLMDIGLHLIVLTTRGRSTGEPRHTAIEYRRHGSRLYVISIWGERPNWFQNLKADPAVTIRRRGQVAYGRAEQVTNAGELLLVLHLFRRRAPAVYDSIFALISDRQRVDPLTLPDISRTIIVVRIDLGAPSPTPPPEPLAVDRAWVSTLVAIVIGVFGVWTVWRRGRSHGRA